jgi:TolB protein
LEETIMKTRMLATPILLAASTAVFLFNACNKESPVGPSSPNIPELPALTDPIPYETLGKGKLVFQRIGPNGGNYEGVYVIDVTGRRSWGASNGVLWGPAVSPDGEKIAYAAFTSLNTKYDVYVMNIDGSNSKRISDLIGQERPPSWTLDSRQVLYYSEMSSSVPLYRQDLGSDPSNKVLIIDFDTIEYPFYFTPEGPVSVTTQGKLAVKVQVNGLYTLNMDGTKWTRLTGSLPAGREFYSPAWSMDGRNIAYLSVLRDSTREYISLDVVLMDADGTNQKSLISLPASGSSQWTGYNEISLCWSPDGSKIAFNKPDGDLISHIYIINSDGSGLTQITSASSVTDRSVSWSN